MRGKIFDRFSELKWQVKEKLDHHFDVLLYLKLKEKLFNSTDIKLHDIVQKLDEKMESDA